MYFFDSRQTLKAFLKLPICSAVACWLAAALCCEDAAACLLCAFAPRLAAIAPTAAPVAAASLLSSSAMPPISAPGGCSFHRAFGACAFASGVCLLGLLLRLLLCRLSLFLQLEWVGAGVRDSPAVTLGLVLGLLGRVLAIGRKHVDVHGRGQRFSRRRGLG